jgi:hypothetical protein
MEAERSTAESIGNIRRTGPGTICRLRHAAGAVPLRHLRPVVARNSADQRR